MYFPNDEVITEQIGVGAFLQARTYDTDFGRYAAGIQAGSGLGDGGWAFRARPGLARVTACTSQASSRPGSWSRRCARPSR